MRIGGKPFRAWLRLTEIRRLVNSMKFGVSIMPDDLVELPRLAKSAEDLGFDYVGVPDSQSLFHELYVSLAVAARATTRVQIGPTVTNPLTRHPAVTASAIDSIDEMSGGRAFLGIGTGDSAVLNLDLRPARLSQLRDYVEAVRAVLSGQTHDYQGRQIHVRRSQTAVPIMVAAEGPKTLALAGAIADIVLVHLSEFFKSLVVAAHLLVHAGEVVSDFLF